MSYVSREQKDPGLADDEFINKVREATELIHGLRDYVKTSDEECVRRLRRRYRQDIGILGLWHTMLSEELNRVP